MSIAYNPPELFDSLGRLPEPAFDSASKQHAPSCLENTRRNILEKIGEWANSNEGKPIFWLKGMAGTGKSTVALTVARQYAGSTRLGASFFFPRGGVDPASVRKFATTVAIRLADTSLELKKYISDAITSDHGICNLGLYNQWDKLVIRPLTQLGKEQGKLTFPLPVVIVVDALDECDNGNDVLLLIKCLTTATLVENVQLRILITSRSDPPINLGLGNILPNVHQGFILHDIEQSSVEQDLGLFYKDRLSYMATKFGLSESILSNGNIQFLVEKSGGLFIHAATVCRFIEEGGLLADKRLSFLMTAGSTPRTPEKELDYIYSIILRHSLPIQLKLAEMNGVHQMFKLIVGSVITLSDTMVPADLAMMLGESKDTILSTLYGLHSLLDVPREEYRSEGTKPGEKTEPEKTTKPIRVFHPSFRDFLLDPVRCEDNAFLIDAKATHSHIFTCCLRLMKDHLKQNICNISSPGISTRDIAKCTVDKFIPLPVQYACRYWVHHLERSNVNPNNRETVDFFQNRLLYWLEALALIGHLSDGIAAMRSFQAKLTVLNRVNLVKPQSTSSVKHKWRCGYIGAAQSEHPMDSLLFLHLIIHDAIRFFLSNIAIIEEAPLQMYCSALVFGPKESTIRQYFSHQIPNWITRLPIIYEYWDSYLPILSHSAPVSAVAFSPDGQLIVSASDDGTVRLLDAITGIEQRTFLGHANNITAVTFLPDGRLLASASDDGTVRLLDTITGIEQRTFQGHSNQVTAVAFSPDGQLIALASEDRTVQLWDMTTGMLQRMFRGHESFWITGIAFSPDGQLIASVSWDHTARIWEAATGKERYQFWACSSWGMAVAFSPDGQLMAAALGHATIQLWDTTTGMERRIFENYLDWTKAIAFSPDGKFIASASDDHTIKLWDVSTGTVHRTFQGHSNWANAIAFSPNGRLIASGSKDSTVRVWDASTDTKQHTQHIFQGHLDQITAIAFSLNNHFAASASGYGTIRLWNATTGTERRVFKGHSDRVTAIAFSPDSQLIASASFDSTVRLWDVTTGIKRCIQPVLHGHWNGVTAVAFSPDGRFLASASSDGIVQFWGTTTGKEQNKFRVYPSWATAIAFSPEGQLIALALNNGTIQLWNATINMVQRIFEGHLDKVTAIAFSKDGQSIASASADSTIRLWDAATGMEQHVYEINLTVRYLSFRGTCLVTDRGILQLSEDALQPQHHIFASGSWIQEDGKNLLFLHPDYRKWLAFVSQNVIVFINGPRSSVLQLGYSSESVIGAKEQA